MSSFKLEHALNSPDLSNVNQSLEIGVQHVFPECEIEGKSTHLIAAFSCSNFNNGLGTDRKRQMLK